MGFKRRKKHKEKRKEEKRQEEVLMGRVVKTETVGNYQKAEVFTTYRTEVGGEEVQITMQESRSIEGSKLIDVFTPIPVKEEESNLVPLPKEAAEKVIEYFEKKNGG